jgi:hypothetical protein
MKSQTEHINIHNIHLISEMFTIYLPFLYCYYQNEYKLTKELYYMPYSKAKTVHVQVYLLRKTLLPIF